MTLQETKEALNQIQKDYPTSNVKVYLANKAIEIIQDFVRSPMAEVCIEEINVGIKKINKGDASGFQEIKDSIWHFLNFLEQKT